MHHSIRGRRAAALGTVFAASLTCAALVPAYAQDTQAPAAPQDAEVQPEGNLTEQAQASENLSDEAGQTRPRSFSDLATQVSPSVVNITTATNVARAGDDEEDGPQFPDGSPFEDFFRDFQDRNREGQPRRSNALGSGFVISEDGYIVTNNHVIEGADEITIEFYAGFELDAEVVGTDAATDIALLKVEPTRRLPYLAFEERGDAVVGEWAIALGNPFGLFEAAEPTVTVGVVSAIGRDFPAQQGRIFRDMIQTDAAINSGNSGGPLVNALGRVIGVNTFIYSRTGGSVGLGFSVPAWRARQVVAELRETGTVDRSFYTGLSIRPVSARLAQQLGLGDAEGLVVTSIETDSPAEQAGLLPRDVIVSIDGEEVATNEAVRERLVDRRAGDTIRLGVLRRGRALDVPLRLGQAQ